MSKSYLMVIAVLGLFVPALALGQSMPAPDLDDDGTSNGQIWRNYTVRQSIEFGGRITETDGNQQMYDTLVNLQSGPRLLGQELSMRSMKQNGSLFDNLYLSMFGLGGDPNDVIRLRVEKNKWYNFVGLYRRDQNFFDDNLFDSTLNPVYPASPLTSNFGYVNSPHMQETTRNMGDFHLTLFPQSAIRFRLGYSRNDNQGDVFNTIGTSAFGFVNDFHMRSDRYTFGIDVRPFKRTTISFDQSYVHDKVDNSDSYNIANAFPVAGNPALGLVNIGSVFAAPPYAGLATGLPVSCIVTNNTIGSTSCAGAYSWNFADKIRTDIPTSQLSLHSNYFRKLDITASGTYSDANMGANLNFPQRGGAGTASYLFGNAVAERIEGNFDLGLTYHINRSWKVSDQFRWLNWHDPNSLQTTTDSCLSSASSANSNLTTPFALGKTGQACLIPSSILSTLAGPAGALVNPAAAGTIQTGTAALTFLGERTYTNTAKLGWDPTRKFSAYIGYRYKRLEEDSKGTPDISGTLAQITPLTVSAAGVVTNGALTPSTLVLLTPMVAKVDQHTALGGLVFRPISAWRINADVELLSADQCSGCTLNGFNTLAFTNISPRHEQRYRAGTVYKFKWVTLNASVHIIESRNDYGASNTGAANTFAFQPGQTSAYGNLSHMRTYTVGFSLDPTRRLGMDVGWTYQDQKILANTCMIVNPALVATPALGTAPSNFCYQQTTNGDLPLLLQYGEDTNSVYLNLRFKPIKRVTLNAGYELTSSSGYNNWLRMDAGNQPFLVSTYNTVNPGSAVVTGQAGAGTVGGLGLGPNPLVPAGGSLDTNWHKAFFGLAYDVHKGLALKGMWSYYDYNEKDVENAFLLLPRDFHVNTATISLKYSF